MGAITKPSTSRPVGGSQVVAMKCTSEEEGEDEEEPGLFFAPDKNNGAKKGGKRLICPRVN